jgi:hypothetical protein
MVNVALPTAAEVAQTRQSCYPTPYNLSDETRWRNRDRTLKPVP